MDRGTPSLGLLTSGADAAAHGLGARRQQVFGSGQLQSVWLGPTSYSGRCEMTARAREAPALRCCRFGGEADSRERGDQGRVPGGECWEAHTEAALGDQGCNPLALAADLSR